MKTTQDNTNKKNCLNTKRILNTRYCHWKNFLSCSVFMIIIDSKTHTHIDTWMHAHIKNKLLIWQQQYFYWFDFPVNCADTPFTTSAKSNVLFQLRKHTCDCSQCLLYRFYPVLSHLFLSGVRVCVCFGALPVLHALPREAVASVLKDSSVSFSLCVSVYQPCLLQTGCLSRIFLLCTNFV